MFKIKYLYLLLIISSPLLALSQFADISGTVTDSITHQPIAFAGITVKETKRGVLTDIDGHFLLKNVPHNSTLVISYTGYYNRQVTVSKNIGSLLIFLSRKNEQLEEVVVKSDLNPAHRIILLMQKNRKKNDPFYINSYSYNAYSVSALGAGPHLWNLGQQMQKTQTRKPSKPQKSKMNAKDSAEMFQMKFAAEELRKNYLFVAETYTERLYRYPRQVKETILASKISGIKNPLFAVTQGNFEYFGFYYDYLPLGQKTYTTPLVNGSINIYKFSLRQVIPHETDSTFVISFEPKPGRNFTGLKGILYINSDGYAIENVVAAPADEKNMIFSFHLQQKYERMADGKWFPSQINNSIIQKDLAQDSVLLYWDYRTYLKNVVFNPIIKSSEFSDIALEIPPGIGKKTEEEWNGLRADTLRAKEKATYHAYDTMPHKALAMFNGINNLTEAFALQAIPWGKVDIPFQYLLSGVNRYEKIRLGAGFQTNLLWSKWFSVGGYGGYGIGDKSWKYGSNLVFTFNRRTHTELHLSFEQDLQEPGNIPYFSENAVLYSNQVIRSLYTSRLDSIRQWRALFNTKPIPNLQLNTWILQEQRSPAGFVYAFDINNNNQFIHQYNNTEVGIGLRYTFRETYARLGRAIVMNTPPRTQIMMQLSKGLPGPFDGQLDYTKFALQVNETFRTKSFGRTSLQASVGKVWGNVPYAYLFTTSASGQQGRGLFVSNSFQTVGTYEFNSSSTAALFLQQNFGNLLFKPSNAHFRPDLVLVHNMSFGTLSNPNAHLGITLQAPEKGLFEGGVLVNNLYRANMRFFYWGLGLGLFRRYGYYTLPEKRKNWAFKFGLTFSF